MVQHKELTFMPKLTCEYELTSLDILPKEYDAFLTECAQIYCRQAYPDLKTDDKFFRPFFNVVGQVNYVLDQEDQIVKLSSGIDKRPSYYEGLGIDEQLDVHQEDFVVKVGERLQHMSTKLDQRFPNREGKFPNVYLKKLDLSSKDLEILASLKYDALDGRMDISLKTEGYTMQDRSKSYYSIRMPVIAITLSEGCAEYTKLEEIMENMEGALKNKYDFDRRKTIRAYTERKTVELEGKHLRVA